MKGILEVREGLLLNRTQGMKFVKCVLEVRSLIAMLLGMELVLEAVLMGL